MTGKKVDRIISLRNRYIPAILLIAIFISFAYVNVEQIIKSIENDAKIINISGRQRMLSQNLVLLGFEYIDSPSEKNRLSLEENIKLMRSSHNYLIQSDKDNKLDAIYNEKALSLQIDKFLAKFEDFLKNRNQKLLLELSSQAQLLLPLLSEAVQEYENINNLKVKYLEQKQFYVFIATIVIILLEMLFVFYPASRKMKEHTNELEEFNSHLEEKVQQEVAKNREKDKQMLEQSKLAQMGEMINMIAHQWRQPLNAISSSAIKLSFKSELGVLQNDEIIESSKFIQNETQKMSEVINDFMEFNKPDTNKEFFIHESVDAVGKMITPQLQNKSITLEIEIDRGLKVFHNTKSVEHVLLNLITNSRDAFDDKKDLQNKRIKILTAFNEEYITLSVEDNAGGMHDNIIMKVFNPYFTTKEQGKGSGIGLYMSKRMIEYVPGSTIQVDVTGNNTLFTIKFKNNNLNRVSESVCK